MDRMIKESSTGLNEVFSYVEGIQRQIDASAAAVYVIHNDKVIEEWYSGRHHYSSSRSIQQDSRFNVFSVRKSYIGLATAIALHEGKIASLDDYVTKYLDDTDERVVKGITLRHIVTHTHGLELHNGQLVKRFRPSSDWAYNGAGLSLLYEIIKITTGQTVAEILEEKVFDPLGFKETGWENCLQENFVYDILDEADEPSIRLGDESGFERNLFVSARELANWGYLHLKKGKIYGKQVLTKEIFERVTSIQTPEHARDIPQNGFFWFRNENQYEKSELGEQVPEGSYQILGKSGCTCLVFPQYNAVAVRMYNKIGNPPGYDYLRDIKDFGNRVADQLKHECEGSLYDSVT